MKQPIYYLIVFCLCSFQFELLGQLDQCKGLPPYFLKKGINPQKAYLSTSEKFLVGMALIESEQPGNPNAKITKVIQDSSWTDKGFLGAICTDQSGNSYVLPSAKVNLLKNPLENQNTIYKVDANTGMMNAYVQIPMDILPGSFNPFGLLGSFYDCSTSQLIVSTVAGSSENREIGKVCKIDIKTKEITTLIDHKDIYGLALHIHHFWAKFGLILSVLSWSALGMAGASFFIWLFFGRERIIITPEYLITDKPLVFFYRRNFYTLKEIANIRLDKEIYKVNRKGEWVDESRPVIKFDTDKKLVTFARGIAKEEAEQIILEIAKSSPLQKEQFSAEHKI